MTRVRIFEGPYLQRLTHVANHAMKDVNIISVQTTHYKIQDGSVIHCITILYKEEDEVEV